MVRRLSQRRVPEPDVCAHRDRGQGVRRQHRPPGKDAPSPFEENEGEAVEGNFEGDEQQKEGESEAGFADGQVNQLGDQDTELAAMVVPPVGLSTSNQR
jgi:hypothetical protein